MDFTSQTQPAVSNLNTSFVSNLFAAAKTRLRQHRVYRETYAELSMLGDRELADLGLSRSMLRSIARESAARS